MIVFYFLSDSNIIRSMPEQTGEEKIVQFFFLKQASVCFKNTVFTSVILFIALVSGHSPEGIGEDEAAGSGSESSGLRTTRPTFHVPVFVKGVD